MRKSNYPPVLLATNNGCRRENRTLNSCPPNLSAEQATERLRRGLIRFHQRLHGERPAEQARTITESLLAGLHGGQTPFACILGCADSRVVPEIVFDAAPGDLFVCRVAGNIAPPDVSGTIEYAVEYLGVRLVVVLGHEGCGAVSAAIEGMEPKGDLRCIVEAISPAIEEARGLSSSSSLLLRSVQANARMVARTLRDDEPILAGAFRNGGLVIQPATYYLNGQVHFHEPIAT